MFDWLIANGPTILVGLLVLALVVLAVFVLRRDKKRGKSSCGGCCGTCAMAGKCHAAPDDKSGRGA